MSRRRAVATVLTLALVAPATALTTTAASAAPAPPAPVTPTAQPVGTTGVKRLPPPTRDRAAAREHDPHAVLVRFAPSASGSTRDLAVRTRGGRVANAVAGTGFVTVRTTGSADALASRLAADPSVAEVSLDYVRASSASPNDYLYAVDRRQEYLKTVRLPTAWDRSKGSLSQVVAVLDSGVNGRHPDLTGRTVAGFDAINDRGIPAGAASDDFGHGSMVAGIIAAETNNTEGIAGVAWNARIMPVKVLDSRGRGTDSDIIQGLTWAVDHGAKVVNLSLGGPGDSPALHAAVRYAVAKGAVVVVAAGNTGGDRPEYPAAYPEALAVAATDNLGRLTYFSTHGSWVDVAAPGWDIVSTERGSDYYIGSGTSFSAPIVSGIASLLRARNRAITPAQIIGRLRATARDAGPRGLDPYYGAGIVDATSALGGSWAPDLAQPATGLREPNDLPARAVPVGVPTIGTIGIEGDVDWYRYTSTAERAVTVAVTPPPSSGTRPQELDPAVAVYDTNLELVGSADRAAEGSPESLTVRMGVGTYYVVVRNANGARVPDRAYRLALTPDTRAGVLAEAQPVAGPLASYRSLAVGDVTGDGRADVVAAPDGTLSGRIHVFRQTTTGGLGAPSSDATVAASPVRDVVVADLDGDMLPDVVTATDGGIQVFRQTAAHTLAAPTVVPDTAGTRVVRVADVDGDARPDLVRSTATGVAVLLAGPDGTWAPEVVDDAGSAEIEVGDLDGDGRADLAVTHGPVVRVLHHRATGWAKTDHPVIGGTDAGGVEVADVTGDGRADLAAVTTAAPGGAQLHVWRQGADGSLSAPTRSALADLPQPLEAADVTGDGRLDLVTAHGGGHDTVTVLEQRAGGALAAPSTSYAPTAPDLGPTGLGLADLTGDGRVDAVVPSPTGLQLLRNAGGPTRGGAPWWVGSATPSDFAGMTLTYRPTVTFARAVVPTSITSATVRLVDGRTGVAVPTTVTYDAARRTATIRPRGALHDAAPYRIAVSGVRDTSGATMTTAYSSTFRTVDVAPPAAGSFTATGGYRSATLSWKAPAITDLDRYVVRMTTGAAVPTSVASGSSAYAGTGTKTVVALTQGTTYTFRIWVRDRSGRYSAYATRRLVGTGETVASSTTALRRGGAVTVSSRLTRKDTNGPVAGAPMRLYQRRVGSTAAVLVATRTATASGTVSATLRPSASVDYWWVYLGSTSYVGSGSSTRRVTVR